MYERVRVGGGLGGTNREEGGLLYPLPTLLPPCFDPLTTDPLPTPLWPPYNRPPSNTLLAPLRPTPFQHPSGPLTTPCTTLLEDASGILHFWSGSEARHGRLHFIDPSPHPLPLMPFSLESYDPSLVPSDATLLTALAIQTLPS
eukprot:396161-Prorocentrum_minimum.AAC.1